jgi:hypothetical protein
MNARDVPMPARCRDGQALTPGFDPMAKPEPAPNRHHFRVWIKMAIQSGLIEKLPPLYDSQRFQSPLGTVEYARQLLAELRDPDASTRMLKEIIAEARQFKSWVEARRKDSRLRILVEGRPEERIIDMPPGRPRPSTDPERRPRRSQRNNDPDTCPKLHPMWDNWIDGFNQ